MVLRKLIKEEQKNYYEQQKVGIYSGVFIFQVMCLFVSSSGQLFVTLKSGMIRNNRRVRSRVYCGISWDIF